MLRLTQLYVYFIIIFLLLATSFGLKSPLSGQYLQRQKTYKLGAYTTKTSILWHAIYIH